VAGKIGLVPWNKGNSNKLDLVCSICNKTFKFFPSECKKRATPYICKDCKPKSKTNLKCNFCGQMYNINTHNFNQKIKNKQTRFYCSKNCFYNYNTGKHHACYGKTISDERKEFIRQIGKKFGGKNNPMFRKVGLYGKNYFYDDLGHQCRSSWEVNYARILRYNKVDYKYEPMSFKLSNGDSYTPDFYLTKENKYIEIKGYVRDKFTDKFNRFKQEYPNINIDIIDEKKYYEFEKIYKSKIDWEVSSQCKQNWKFKETKIKSIKNTKYYIDKIYNLSIEDDESFIINGIVVHNTKPQPFIRETLEQELPRLLADALRQPGAIEIITQES
jgi:hypothetical protein